jgi:hypothetical protein
LHIIALSPSCPHTRQSTLGKANAQQEGNAEHDAAEAGHKPITAKYYLHLPAHCHLRAHQLEVATPSSKLHPFPFIYIHLFNTVCWHNAIIL